jgi:hypothetical protein
LFGLKTIFPASVPARRGDRAASRLIHNPEAAVKKLRLQVDDVRIESFPTLDPRKGRGTVNANECTCYYTCDGFMTYGGPDQPCVICG